MKFIKKNGETVEFNGKEIEKTIENINSFYYPTVFYKGFATDVARNAEMYYEMANQIPTGYDVDDFIFYRLVDSGYITSAKQFERIVAVSDYCRHNNIK